jgi:hypothetical protein
MKFWPDPILQDPFQLSTNTFTTELIRNGNNSHLTRTNANNRK